LRDVIDGRECLDAPLPGPGLGVSFNQLQEMLVFESCECLLVHEG